MPLQPYDQPDEQTDEQPDDRPTTTSYRLVCPDCLQHRWCSCDRTPPPASGPYRHHRDDDARRVMLLLLGLWGVALLAATAGGLVVGARPGIAEAGLLHAATLAVLVVLWSLPWRRFVVATVAVSALLGLLVGLTSAPTGPPPGRPALPVPGLS